MNFQERRDIVEQWIRELADQEKLARDEREAWERALIQLDAPINQVTPVLSNPTVSHSHREPGRNAQMVQTVLEDVGKPQPINYIARKLHEAGLVNSPKRGYQGVYAIVSTILRRNPGKRFIQLPNGWWDLSKRHQPALDRQPERQNNNASKNGRPDRDFTPDKIGVPVNLKELGYN